VDLVYLKPSIFREFKQIIFHYGKESAEIYECPSFSSEQLKGYDDCLDGKSPLLTTEKKT